MDIVSMYPKECRKSIRRLTSGIGLSAETAYSMMLMTAALMDLRPEDDDVVEIIMADAGIFPEVIA